MIELKNLTKTFVTNDNTVQALKDVNITINDGEIFGIIGMSGAGKSTLVRCINMLEKPTSGSVIIDGVDITSFSQKQLRSVRSSIAMIFQGFNLLMQRNCIDNICFPMELAKVPRAEALNRARVLLKMVGLEDKEKAYPAQLSGGQKQRIAIARALSMHPKVLLCDEATSALDPNTTSSILDLITSINQKTGITVIVITHQMSVVEKICHKVAILDEGVVVEEGAVSEIFTKPKSNVAKKLVFPDNLDFDSPNPGEKYIRAVFDGKTSADSPLIAKMALKENIIANIRSASTKSVSGKLYGNMILSLPDDPEIIKRAEEFLKSEGVITEGVDFYG